LHFPLRISYRPNGLTRSGNRHERAAVKLAIIASQPTQYYSPWFRYMAGAAHVPLRVFYLGDFGIKPRFDPGFQADIEWDIPLLDGYDHTFVPNKGLSYGSHGGFLGLWNPSIVSELAAYEPTAILLIGYNYATSVYVILRTKRARLVLRGDSHRLVRRVGPGEYVRRRLISLLFRRFSAFLYVGHANYEYFRYHGVPERKLFRAPHAVDNARFRSQASAAMLEAGRWKQELGISPEDLVVLFAGKFESKKRPLDLLRAFASAQMPRTSLLFVGSGPLEQQLKAAAQGNAKVYFAPFQNQTLMPRTYCAGDLFVLPSFGPAETWGLAVNEAMCMARPVIVSDHVGCARDLVTGLGNGLVFPAGDVGALTACLRDALSDPQRLRLWGERSRTIIENYSYERATQGLLDALS
jgi:glycosyltransferase involved in cell wall biosynthesis